MNNDLTAEQLSQPVTVILPLGALLRIGKDAHAEQALAFSSGLKSSFAVLPAIGAPYQDGTYAGLSIEDERPVALILLPGDIEADWNKAAAWAQEQGGALPSRIDQLVLFKNLKSEFRESWYWSGEQFAGSAGYAWCQDFSYGYQDGSDKYNELRARAVRRLPVQ